MILADDDGPVMPVRGVLAALREAIGAGRDALLVAPPGAGKTSLAPLALLGEPGLGCGRIIVLEPRRLAARAAAVRMASLLGEPVGARVGYRTRTESAVSERTQVEVVTEGLLVARLLAEPTLEDVPAVVFDEVHERTLDGELALAFCLDLQRSRPELRLLAMSATVDVGAIASVMKDPVLIRSEGRAWPVSITYAARDVAHPRDLPDQVVRAAIAALDEQGDEQGDVLVFLPGKAEIARAAAALAPCGATILRLHGDMRLDEQARVLRPPAAGERRIVLATSIAETSLTVPGVRTVVDGGWRRAPRLDAGRGLARLATLRISRAAAEQRAGRAGREAPGRCHRLWTQASHRGLAPFERPELLEAELAGLRLATACWQAAWGTDPATLRFADPPTAGALETASALLRDLGALSGENTVTPLGQRMARLGAHPRLAASMLAAADPGETALAADLAALLEERDPCAVGGEATTTDVALRLAALSGHAHGDRAVIARVRDASRLFRRRLGTSAEPAGDAAALLAAAFPDRIAQGRGEAGHFRLSGGGSASLPVSDPLARAGLLVAAGLHLGRSTRITLAAELDPDKLPPSLLARTTGTIERGVDGQTGAVFNRQRLRLGALVLQDRLLAADPSETAAALAAAAAPRLDALLDWTDAARNLRSRVAIARRLGIDVPDFSDEALAADTTWLAEPIAAARLTRLAELGRLDLGSILRSGLTQQARHVLDLALPTHLELPGGRAALDYTAGVPTASARAQAFYGLDRMPEIAGGRVGLTLALLSPAGRPVALTRDLPGFWRGGWHEVRADMRGRYPRHDWPEEPWRGPAQRRLSR